MKFDALVRLIGAADPSSLRELALLCLHARGFAPEVTDGPNDGGRDLRLFTLSGGQRYAVQTSVEADWRTKLRKDALLAKKKFGVTDMLFVSSRRLPEVDFVALQDELAAKGIRVQKMDVQGIASLLHTRGLIPKALNVLGVAATAPAPQGFAKPDLRQEVAWAYVFFGAEPDTFRRGVIERAILAAVSAAGGTLSLEDVVDRVSLSLGLAPNQRDQVRPAIDRMRQEHRLGGRNGTVQVSDEVRSEHDALRALRIRAREDLAADLVVALRPWVTRDDRRRTLVEQLMGDVGGLLLDDARVTARALAHERTSESFTEARARARRLFETLAAFGLDGDDSLRDALVAIAATVRSSTFGRQLLAGEVFVNLLSLRTSQLVTAIAGKRTLRAVLDASVAMPLLAGLLYAPVAQRYSVAARHAYDQFARHGVEVMVPADHVEEMAAHLYEAWSYRDFIADEPDLRASQNAFVSHFVGMGASVRAQGETPADSFARYLEGLGLHAGTARADFLVARRQLERALAQTLERYQIGVERLGVGAGAIDAVRAELDAVIDAWQQQPERGQRRSPRPDVLLRHDARTIAWLDALPTSTEQATVFCTWDRLIFDLHERSPRIWEALTPAQLGDALTLAAPDEDDASPPVSVLDLALSLADEDAERGAKVLDRLVRLEKDEGFDAQRIAEMRRFKREWLNVSHPRPLEDAWAEWKHAHLPPKVEAT